VASQELSDQEGGGRAQSSLDGDDGRRPSIPPQVFPDNQQVFVGNLPQYLPDKELHEFFGRTLLFTFVVIRASGLVAERLACWTKAKKGLGSDRSRNAVG